MSSTTIKYRDAEFVANDLPIEVWMLEVAHQIDSSQSDPWLLELKAEWHLQATSGFGFGPTPALDRFVTSEDRREQLATYFRKTLESLTKRKDIIPPDELDQSKIGGPDAYLFTSGLPTTMVIDVGNRFLSLIDLSTPS
jgi:hypothetical protein